MPVGKIPCFIFNSKDFLYVGVHHCYLNVHNRTRKESNDKAALICLQTQPKPVRRALTLVWPDNVAKKNTPVSD